MTKGLKAARRENKTRLRGTRCAQDLVPALQVYEDGIFLLPGGSNAGRRYSKTWRYQDINFSYAAPEIKAHILSQYCALLNAMDVTSTYKLTINSHKMDRVDFEQNVLLKSRNDAYNQYRDDYNGMLELRVAETSGVVQDKYLTVATTRKTLDDARAYFARAKTSLNTHFQLLGTQLEELTAGDRLKVFHDFFNAGAETQFRYNAEDAKARGYSFKEAICPEYAELGRSYFRLGERWGRVLFLRDYATFLSDEFIAQLSSLNRNMMISIDIVPECKEEAIKLAESRMLAMSKNRINYLQKAQNRKDYSQNVPYYMEQQNSAAQEFMDDLANRNQNMFYATVTCVITSETKEQLDADTEALKSVAQEYLCRLGVLGLQQLEGLNTVLPWGMMSVAVDRTLTTESLMVLSPFKVQDIVHKNGIYYGQNAVSHNMILIDGTVFPNANGMVLGIPGAGKSFLVKEKVSEQMLATDADIIIIDPEREYSELVRALGGDIAAISAASAIHINAMDMAENYGVDNEADFNAPIHVKAKKALTKKVAFLLSLCEQFVGGEQAVGAAERTLIDRACVQVYKAYIDSGFTIEPPTLADFNETLNGFPEPEAKQLALKLGSFTTGTLAAFSYQTNVNTDSRLLCYDIHDLESSLMSHGLLVILDGIINRIARNRANGRRTYIYIDEIYLLFKYDYSAEFLSELWKRVRKYNAAAIGITQNVSDILQSPYAEKMFNNSQIITMLAQSPLDLDKLADILKLSDAQTAYLENPAPGSGLLKVGSAVIPFTNDFPRDTKLYALMSTKPGETLTVAV
ncbi:MAG: ATP-binding protein [Oscillospiraceae bacterium]|jgi:hypothetical protein|nr:ATP-binding protein [Oscillospiraceae bacterium]